MNNNRTKTSEDLIKWRLLSTVNFYNFIKKYKKIQKVYIVDAWNLICEISGMRPREIVNSSEGYYILNNILKKIYVKKVHFIFCMKIVIYQDKMFPDEESLKKLHYSYPDLILVTTFLSKEPCKSDFPECVHLIEEKINNEIIQKPKHEICPKYKHGYRQHDDATMLGLYMIFNQMNIDVNIVSGDKFRRSDIRNIINNTLSFKLFIKNAVYDPTFLTNLKNIDPSKLKKIIKRIQIDKFIDNFSIDEF